VERREAWSAKCLHTEETDLALATTAFIIGAIVSLATSWVLVTCLERIGERLGLTEALLGVIAALAADAPEITSAVSAVSQHQRAIGAGVVIGSNAFNLAALLGLGALVSGFIALHRRVVALGGLVAVWIAIWCVLTSAGFVPPWLGLILTSVVLSAYFIALGVSRDALRRIALPRVFTAWLSSAIDEEEEELEEAIRPAIGGSVDVVLALVALVIVVAASIAMERGASTIGHHLHVADAVVGGVALAAVTSLPNAVAAIHLAAKRRGAAAFSTALTSNNLNVVAGFLIPGAIVGVARSNVAGNLTALSYLVLTVLVLVVAFARRGLSRRAGLTVIAGYLLFIAWLLAVT
jgi:cation:H+ antiporter